MSPRASTPWVGLTVLAFAVLGAVTTEVVPIGLIPAVTTAFDVDEATAGILVSLYAVIAAVSAVPLTHFTRRLPRKPVLLVTLSLFAASNLLAALAPTFAVLVASRALAGLAHSLFFAVSIGYATRIAPPGQIGRAMAFVATGTTAGLILGIPAGTALAEAFGWRTTFGVLAALTGLAVVAAIFVLPAVTHVACGARSLVPGGSRMLLVCALAGLAYLGYYTLYSYVSPMLLSVGVPDALLSLALTLLGVAGLVAIRLVANRLDRRPFGWLVMIPALIAITQLALVLVYPHLWPVLIVAALWTAAFGPVTSTYQNVLVRVGRTNPDMSGAWINVTCNIGIGVGAALGGALVIGPGYTAAGLVGVGILVVTAVVTLLSRRPLAAAIAD